MIKFVGLISPRISVDKMKPKIYSEPKIESISPPNIENYSVRIEHSYWSEFGPIKNGFI